MDISQLKEIILDQKQEYVPTDIIYRDSFAMADKFLSNKTCTFLSRKPTPVLAS